MLKIGFANKHFTLWNVVEDKQFEVVGGMQIPFERTYYHFKRNLAMTEEKALKTAVLLGCNDLQVDNDLRGKSGSFCVQKTFPKVDSKTSKLFDFGKYKGQEISQSKDQDYLFWYFQETRNENAKEVLLQEFGFFEYKKQLIDKESYFKIKEERAFLRRIATAGNGFATMTSNLNSEGVGRAEIDSQMIYLRFPDFKKMNYQGIEYSLPIINEKAKRIKGKDVEIIIKSFDAENSVFEVESFKILTEQIIY